MIETGTEPTTNPSLNAAYEYCEHLAASHYENFPVASKLLKPEIRKAVTVIYSFARTADDFADEGELTQIQRQEDLAQYHKQLQWLRDYDCANFYDNPAVMTQCSWINPEIFIALDDVIKQFNLPFEPFHRLLIAFEQDVFKKHFITENDLLSYCQNSANPVGELLLYLNRETTEETIHYSNAICTALQLINFIQDYHQDITELNRLYMPLKDAKRFDIDIKTLLTHICDGNHFSENEKQLYRYQIKRAQDILKAGKPLLNCLSGRFKREIAMIYYGGQTVLNKLKKAKSFKDRPRLNKWDKIKILFKSGLT